MTPVDIAKSISIVVAIALWAYLFYSSNNGFK
jgi:hypothetical protein